MKTVPRHWLSQLETSDQPAYVLIADLIAEDVRSGRLTARDRLPPLRQLADELGLNYTTVARGYGEARKRGLIDAHAGMGSFVRGSAPALPLRGGGGAEMSMNMPPEPDDPALQARLRASVTQLFAQTDWHDLLRYQDFGGTPMNGRWRPPGCAPMCPTAVPTRCWWRRASTACWRP